MAVTVRTLSRTVTFAGVVLADVLSARGQVSADGGWPTCSVFVTAKPMTGNEEDSLTVVAGAGNNVTRFTGKVRRFRSTFFPKGLELVSTGTLAYADEWAPNETIRFALSWPSGATDQQLVAWALDHVPTKISYSSANIAGTGITLGLNSGLGGTAFDWQAGTSAWAYIRMLDRVTLYRTYQTQDGTIRRVRMIGHPNTTDGFTLGDQDVLEGALGNRNTEQTRNAVEVIGYDYGRNGPNGKVYGTALGNNGFQGDATNPNNRYPDKLQSDLIEDGNDITGTPLGLPGLNAQDLADAMLPDVNKEFVAAEVPSWRDDTHGPGMTCLLDCLNRLAIGESMWVQGYGWEITDSSWTSNYSLSGGGLEQSYTPPPV